MKALKEFSVVRLQREKPTRLQREKPTRLQREKPTRLRWDRFSAVSNALLLAVALLVLGCEERTEKTDTGGVLLEIEFTNTVAIVGVEQSESVTIPTMTITSIVADPEATTSSLMDVQLRTLEVTFSRADSGTRVPPPYFFNIISTVPVEGTLTLSNFPIMSTEQTRSPPLSDLLVLNGGFDRETGNTFIRLDVTIRVFGTTLTGTNVASVPRTQTIEFVPTL